MTILRTSRDGCWELRSNSWGTFLAPTVDPLADTVITQEQLDGFELNEDIPKIPRQLWSAWVNLCIEMCKRGTGDLEVSCRLLRHVDYPDRYRICIPVQRVTGASVRVESFDKAVDIETGELIEQWPPENWRPCGSSHSHNTMGAFFSGTDDKYELGDPGLHIVVGTINVDTGEHSLCASITANGRRFLIDPFVVVHNSIDLETPVPKECYDVITISNSVRTSATLPKIAAKAQPWTYWNDNYASPTTTEAQRLLASELASVRSALDTLIRSGQRQNLSINGVLEELAIEIDDMTFYSETVPLNDPPMTWKDDYLL